MSPSITIYPPFILFYLPPPPFLSGDHHTVVCVCGVFVVVAAFAYSLHHLHPAPQPPSSLAGISLFSASGCLFLFFSFFLTFSPSPEDMFMDFRERGMERAVREREGERKRNVREKHRSGALAHAIAGDQMQPFGVWDDASTS